MYRKRRRHCYAACGDLQLKRRGQAIDPVSLQRVADLNALRLVREGTDLEAVERAEIADLDLLDFVRHARQTLALRNLFPQRIRFTFRTAVRELELEAAGRRSLKPPEDGACAAGSASGSASAVRPKIRQLLFFSPPPASAAAFSVVVDQLELAAAGGLLGCGAAAAVWGAGWGADAGWGAGAESLTEPNQRVKRFPLRVAMVVLLG